MKKIKIFTICLFVFGLFGGCEKDTINDLNDLNNGINNGTDNNVNDNTINDTNGNTTNDINNDVRITIDGNWTKNPSSPRSLELEFNLSRSILIFRNYQLGNLNVYHTINRSFSGLEYDGTTIKFKTYLDPPTTITFSGILSEDKLIISGLRSYAYKPATTAGGISYIDLLFWNGTYYRKTGK